jgi:EAL domain-containing protein (putative c-di-GMP-specific phosphodiesterase class I)/GGDEF domain-containing protein/uncharacterized membrane protein affecting hemolysin expression
MFGRLETLMRRKLGLAARFSILVCGLVLALSFMALCLLNGAEGRQRNAHDADIARASALTQAIALQSAVAAGGVLDGHPTLSALAPPLIGVAVFDRNGRLILRKGAPPPSAFVSMTDGATLSGAAVERVEKRTAHAFTPVRRDGRVIGFVEVTLDRAALHQDARSLSLQFLLLTLVFLAAAVPLTILATRRMTAPLRALTEFAKRASAGGFDQRLDMKLGDEFGALAEAFNTVLTRFDRSNLQIRKLAFTDAATGLNNKERMRRDIAQMGRSTEAGFGAVIVVRVHRLQRAGEATRQVGESLVRLVAQRLDACVRAVDGAVRPAVAERYPSRIARLDTADFAVHISHFANPAELRRFALDLRAALSVPVEWQGHRLALEAALGVAPLAAGAADADNALRQAFVALAATSANDPLKFFSRAMDREAAAALSFESDLRDALAAKEFLAFFQPKVSLLTGKIIGAEALARWIKPDGSMISPGRFIPVAERIGMIGPMSDIIMSDACWKAASWRKRGFDAKVAVNISPLQFADDRFTDKVQRLLSTSGLEPGALELEITESVAMESPERALALIKPLREQGVRISLDDFGCGHSSLAALTRLPIDAIKIDQQFVRALSKDPNAATIVETILAMAASLNHEVVAEGIETEQEAQFLRRRGCTIGQGFLYGAATPAEEFVARVLPPDHDADLRKTA